LNERGAALVLAMKVMFENLNNPTVHDTLRRPGITAQAALGALVAGPALDKPLTEALAKTYTADPFGLREGRDLSLKFGQANTQPVDLAVAAKGADGAPTTRPAQHSLEALRNEEGRVTGYELTLEYDNGRTWPWTVTESSVQVNKDEPIPFTELSVASATQLLQVLAQATSRPSEALAFFRELDERQGGGDVALANAVTNLAAALSADVSQRLEAQALVTNALAPAKIIAAKVAPVAGVE
jgi:hypothetical protein